MLRKGFKAEILRNPGSPDLVGGVELLVDGGEGHVADAEPLLARELAVARSLLHVHDVLLPVRRPDWQHQQPARTQLIQQCLRDLVRDGTDVDDIVGRSLRIALASVPADHLDASIVELLRVALAEVDARELAELLHVLNPVDLRHVVRLVLAELVKGGAEIATAASDVEYLGTRAQFRLQALHDISVQMRRTDDNIMFNRQCSVVIRRLLGALCHELGTVDDLHNVCDSLRVHEAILGQTLNQLG